jgi:hypothetical protein
MEVFCEVIRGTPTVLIPYSLVSEHVAHPNNRACIIEATKTLRGESGAKRVEHVWWIADFNAHQFPLQNIDSGDVRMRVGDEIEKQ